MAWKAYEQQVADTVRERFPGARIEANVRVKGRYSKRMRQVDVMVAEDTVGGSVRTIIDAKCFRRKVDVKAVEEFAGLVDDVGVQRGMLITNVGYTQAALRRAFYGSGDLELDVLNFSALQQFQAFGAVPYAGDLSFLVPAPFGWVIDASRFPGCLAVLYERGLEKAEALRRLEFIYINYWDRRRDPLTAAQLDEQQEARLRLKGKVTISHPTTISRSDATARLRVADVKAYGNLEITGFLEFRDVIFYAVLFTPRERQRSNMLRLESILRRATPIELKKDNTILIRKINQKLALESKSIERAKLLADAGHWYRDMGQLDEARAALEESLTLEPRGYYALKELLFVVVTLRDRTAATRLTAQMLRLDPRNPRAFADLFDFINHSPISPSDLVMLIEELKAEYPDDELVRSNCDFFTAQLLMPSDPKGAKKRLAEAEAGFRSVFSRNHQVFEALKNVRREWRLFDQAAKDKSTA